jgi:tetratricopeptide (TPR) repeat protein
MLGSIVIRLSTRAWQDVRSLPTIVLHAIVCLCSFLIGVAALCWWFAADAANEPMFYGLGDRTRHIVTRSATAQRYFDQGLAFLFSFNHEEAVRSFEAAVANDPECAMAYWGIAMGNGPYINDMVVDSAHSRAAWRALNKAREMGRIAAPVEAALIDAVGSRYSASPPTDRRPLDTAYAIAMLRVWKAYPDDADVGVLAAEAILDLRPWDYWAVDGDPRPGTNEALQILESVLAISPRHPFALHLLIHALEGSPHPERAGKAADLLRNLTPGLEHLLHMPSHIDVRLGRWEEAVVANERAIAADGLYWGVARQQRFGAFRYHNYHMLAYAAMMQGAEQKASKAIEQMLSCVPESALGLAPDVYDGYFAMRYELHLRFGRWDSMLAEHQPRDDFPIALAMWHYGKGIAHAAQHEVSLALADRQAFRCARRCVPDRANFHGTLASELLSVADRILTGEICYREGKASEAILALSQAVDCEDRLHYTEPPNWLVPTRHALGATLMQMGKYMAAEAVYRTDLKRHPENGWSLFGLCHSLQMQGKKAEAATTRACFEEAWEHADFVISSSCCCLPNKLEGVLK